MQKSLKLMTGVATIVALTASRVSGMTAREAAAMSCKEFLVEIEPQQALEVAERMASRGPIERYSTCNVQDALTAVCWGNPRLRIGQALEIVRRREQAFSPSNAAGHLHSPSPGKRHPPG